MAAVDYFSGFNTLFGLRPKKAPPMKTIGNVGTSIIGGFITDREKSHELRGVEKYKTYGDIIANCTIVAAGINIFLNYISKTKWKITAIDETPQALELAEFVEEILDDMDTPWSRVVRKLAMYRFHGFAIMEWTAKKRDDGRIGLLDIEHRPQHTIEQWDVDENGNIQGVTQRTDATMGSVYLPRSKLVYVVDDSLTDDPRGSGLLRHTVISYKRLTDYERLEQIGYETDMRGIPVLYAPLEELRQAVKQGAIEKEEAEKFKEDLQKFVKNHIRSVQSGILLPSEQFKSEGDNPSPTGERKFAFELVSGDHYGHADLGEAINRIQKEIARLLGVEQLLLGESSSGSLALARDKSKNFTQIVHGILQEIKQVIDKDVIDAVWALNGFDDKLKPKSSFDDVQQIDVEQISQVLGDIARAGVMITPEDEAVGEIFDHLGLTRPDTELARIYSSDYVTTAIKQKELEQLDVDDVKKPGQKPVNKPSNKPANGAA